MLPNMSPIMSEFQTATPEPSDPADAPPSARPRTADQTKPDQTKPGQAKPGIAARQTAFLLLAEVLDRRRALDDALEHSAELPALEPRDRAFVRLLVATTLRRLGQIDALLRKYLRQMVKPRDAAAFGLMRLGVAQLVFLKTPAHAAIDATVGLAGRNGVAHLKGLINALLRRVAEDGEADIARQEAGKLNLPDWLRRSWETSWGREATRAIGAALLEEPSLDLTTRGDPAIWAAPLDATVLPTGTLRRALGGAVADLPGFETGQWWVQDAAAAIPATLFGDIAGKRVVDLCAAPGGKTAQLAARGAVVTAVDRSASRLKRLEANLTRLGLSAEIVTADAATWTPERRFDAVLLDAPCSATGTIRRHPDIAHLKAPEDLERLTALQDRLIEAALLMLEPGGTLIYCTCSLEAAEGEVRIAHTLAQHPDLERWPITAAELGGRAELLNHDGDLRSLPCHFAEFGGIDGFYAARLVRRH